MKPGDGAPRTAHDDRTAESASAARATRRQALQLGVAAAATSLGWSSRGPVQAREALAREDAGGANEDALDQALRILQDEEPQSRGGLSSHAPMAAEALCALGHPDRALKRVQSRKDRSIELPQPSERIDRKRWRSALANARWGDWRVFFAEELEEARWQEVLDKWVARLAPGLCAAATHGVIRTGHAARGLSLRETPERRGELARGLAYWASWYEALPARAGSPPRAATYAQALEHVPLYWEECHRDPPGRNIVEALRNVAALDHFADARDLVAAPADVSGALSELSATFARVYLRHGSRRHTLGFVHAVTGPCALRRIAPHVRPETARAALPYAWQAAAGLYAVYARKEDGPPRVEPGVEPGIEPGAKPALAPAELVARAVENGDDHVVKFTEVLLAEHALKPDPAYLEAAQDILERL